MSPLIRSLGDVMQIAFVPEDIDAAVQYWTRTMGVGPFFRFDHAQSALSRTTFRGQPCLADYSFMIAYWGDMQVELIQQHNDAPSIYSEWRDSGSEGLHHICIVADDLDQVKKACFAAGCTLLQDGDSEPGNFAYFDTNGGPGTILEVLCPGPEVRACQEQMKQAARCWDGTDPIRPFGA
jgi:hypothetical protein